jgi:hypothetical protein
LPGNFVPQGTRLPGIVLGYVSNVLKQLCLFGVTNGMALAAPPLRRMCMSGLSVSASMTSAPLPASSNLAAKNKSNSVEQQFLKYAEMTPAQRLFDSMLKQLGLSEDDFKAMSPQDQQKVVEKIQQMIKQQTENGTGTAPKGMVADMTA